MFYWFMKHLVAGPIVLKASSGRGCVGLENVPATGAAILASNHLSFIDSVFLPLVLDRRISFLAKSDYFTGKGIKGWADARRSSRHGPAAIDRSGGKASEASLNTGLAVLGARRAARHLPRGHAQPRRQDVPRPHRRRAHGPRGRGAGHPGRDDRHREGHADRHAGCPRSAASASSSASRSTSLGSRAWKATASSSARVTDEIMYELQRLSGPGIRRTSTRLRSRRSARDVAR